MEETNVAFRPVRCKESDLQRLSPTNGYVYFTTDTQKIYCANKDKFIPMGGNSGVYYGNRTFVENETNTGETDFVFNMDEKHIEGDQIPNLNDLILNIPDGGFYRVVNVYGKRITGRRLAVSGSGSDGPAGPGGSTSAKPLITPEALGTWYFKLNDTNNMKIKFSCSSTVDDGKNYIANIKYYFGTETKEETVNYKFGEIIAFDISKYLKSFNTTQENLLQVEVTDAYGNKSYKKDFYFRLIELTLKSDASSIVKVNKNGGSFEEYQYSCKPIGGSGLENLYIEILLSPLNNPNRILYTEKKKITNTNTSYPFPIKFNEIKDNEGRLIIEHGVYLLTARFCATIPLSNPTRIETSNEQYVQLAIYDEAIGTPLIVTDFKDSSIMQYDQFVMKYLIADKSNETFANPIIHYGSKQTTEIATLNAINSWKQVFIESGVYDIAIQYKGAKTPIGTLSVTAYEGDIPVIDSSATEFYLTAMGRSNTQADKDTWQSNGHSAVFENFLWGNENGWVTNEKNETALKITNGAKLTIPTYHPFASNATKNGLTIELDFMFSGVLDYSKPLIHCLSQYEINGIQNIETGFNITGQKATLNSAYYKATTMIIGGEEDENGNINEADMALQALTQYFNEDTRIHLTYVVEKIPEDLTSIKENEFYFVYTYLNGVLSGIMKLDISSSNGKADALKDYPNFPSYMTFDSTYGDIYLYNIRVYRHALDMRAIIKNYIADLADVDKKIALHKDNDIFTADGFIDIKAIQNLSYICGVPYVLFNGGNSMQKKFKDAFVFAENYALPLTKQDYRFMSMKMYDVNKETGETYLAIDVPIEAKNEKNNEDIVTKFDDLVAKTSYLPTRGVQVYGQGTSSMVYPVKNLRLKFIQEEDYPQVYEGACPTEIVCFKADFMDSSSAHNTCTGNLVYDIYQAMGLKTPPQIFQIDNQSQDGVIEYDLVTAIKGFPIVCFYAPGDSTEYQFIGRYNFNLDKATPEPFGFIPQKVYAGKKNADGEFEKETVIDSQGKIRNVVKTCGLLTEIVNGKTVLPLDDDGNEVERDIVQCWEILNNDNGSPTKFLKLKENSPATGLPYATFDECLTTITKKGDKYNWMEYYEDRYPDAIVSGGKFILGDNEEKEYKYYNEDLDNGIFRVSKWINSTATIEATGQTLDSPVYYQTTDISWDKNKTYYTADGQEKVITTGQGVSINDTSTSNSELNSLIIDKNIFIDKVGQGNFGLYAFLYSDNWYLDGMSINIADYGISFSGTPIENNGLTVYYYETNDWSNTLCEKFTVDNKDYRLSKFKTEFTEYFDMNFSLFYYVITLTLLMMDSRAKNMMLASWDQKIWYPIFYDMDTMLGINNTGFNKFSFDTEDDPDDKVFNGFDSVLWNNFRTCFQSKIADFYAEMRKSMTLEKLLKTYNENGTDAWNEAFCSADAHYKYERPYEEGYYDGKNNQQIKPGGISYLYAAQGRRSNHRAWWLSNRLNYLDSKYIPTTYGVEEKPSQIDTFSFRAYSLPEQQSTEKALKCVAQTPPNHKFKLKALNNSYQSIFIGNIVYGPIYTSAGQIAELGPEDVKHEVESYILNPQLISDLGDLSDKYIGSLQFPGIETRLTELNFGRSSRSHPNAYSDYYNNLLSAINLGSSCPYLQKVNIARCTGLKSVDFSQCSRLQIFDAEKSGVTNIDFPANSILQEIYVPDKLDNLTLTNQPYLTTIKFDNTAELVKTIILDNVPNFDSYNLVKEVFSTNISKFFYLTNVNWVITDAQLATENGKLVGIDILDILLSDKALSAKNGYTKAQSLSGNIVINIPGIIVDEYAIYEKYKKLFPNVNISYGENVGELKQSYKMTFMTSNDPSIATVHYTVDAPNDQSLTLGELTSANGPKGEAMRDPERNDTESHTYKFANYWIFNNQKYYTSKITNPEPGAISFESFKDYTSDMTFYPQYEEQDRYYEVKFYDSNNRIVLQSTVDENGATIYLESWLVRYNDIYNGPITNFLYRDDSSLPDYERYDFIGWSETNYGNTNPINPTYINIREHHVTNNLTLYANYKIVDCRTTPSSEEYFTINPAGVVSLKDEYKRTLQGKISVPEKINGIAVTSNGKFKDSNHDSLITHIFFLGNTMTSIGPNSFSNCNNLKTVSIPNSITLIDIGAFLGCKQLVNINLHDNITTIQENAFNGCSNLLLEKLPNKIETIGNSAFQGCTKITIAELPKSLKEIKTWAFGGCTNLRITEFQPSATGELIIGSNCFNWAGIDKIESVTINLGVKCSFGAFTQYGNGKEGVIIGHFMGGYDPDEPKPGSNEYWYGPVPASSMGFDSYDYT